MTTPINDISRDLSAIQTQHLSAYDHTLGRRFKRARKRAGYKTQKQLADRWGVSTELISSIEQGRRTAKPIMWQALGV